MKVRLIEAAVRFEEVALAAPVVLSTGSITHTTVATATVTLEAGGAVAMGKGSIGLSELWSWPDSALARTVRARVLRDGCAQIAARLPRLCGDEAAHPLELGLRLNAAVGRDDDIFGGGPSPFRLARTLCASPFDAAIHDAAGLALDRSAFTLYEEDEPVPSADPLFVPRNATSAIRALLRPRAGPRDAWLVVGPRDDLADDVPRVIRERGYRCFKLKLSGRDPVADAALTASVYRVALACGRGQPRVCGDSNGGARDTDAVLHYLEHLRSQDRDAFEALHYIEQPAGRVLDQEPHDWRAVAAVKPVLVDEGLTGLDVFDVVLDQGWSGLGLKTCKGHSLVLTAAAWARDHGLMVSLQDLTNPGFAALHGALFSGWVPTINGLELNSPQFLPTANEAFAHTCPGLFHPRDGVHQLPPLDTPGLGSGLLAQGHLRA